MFVMLVQRPVVSGLTQMGRGCSGHREGRVGSTQLNQLRISKSTGKKLTRMTRKVRKQQHPPKLQHQPRQIILTLHDQSLELTMPIK